MIRFRYSISVLALVTLAGTVQAQEPVKPPPRDTAAVPADTTVQDTTPPTPVVADSIRPIPQFPRHDLGPAHGFSDAVWYWDRESFLREGVVTLGDLLERIPGIVTMRAGLYLQPEAVSSMGGTANRLEVFLDGYALDPLHESSFDVAKFELVHVENVRIERRLGTIRVHIETLAPKDNRAYSMVEAGVGEPDASLFRGTFLAPKVLLGPLSLGIDRVDTDGLLRAEPADQFAGWAKWSFIYRGFGLQVEYRRIDTERNPESPWVAKFLRSDLIARARAQIAPGLVAEAFGGRGNLEADTSLTRADSIPRMEEESTQWGGRLSFTSPLFWARGSYRARDAEALPESQLEGAAGVRYKVFAAAVEATRSSWRTIGTTSEHTLRAEAGPFKGFRLFGETTSSDRGVPYVLSLPDSAGVITLLPEIATSNKGYRAGASVDFRGISIGGALLKVETDSVTTFGLPFDRTPVLYQGSDVQGGEIQGRIPLPLIKGLYAQGSLTHWQSGVRGLYLPDRLYRAGIELHTSPLRSGNLEILLRLEQIHRGVMLVPNPLTGEDEPALIEMPATDLIDGYLQIRIIDVRAYLRYEDMSGQDAPDVLGRPLRGPRIFYGVKWQFFN